MAYPDDKETFRRVVNQDLPTVPGDTVDENDQNLPADFIERLQDTFGLNIKMGFSTVKLFFDDIVSKFASIKKYELIVLHESPLSGIKESGYHNEYGVYFSCLPTDILFFLSICHWRQWDNDIALLRLNFRRTGSDFGPIIYFDGIGSRKIHQSSIMHVLTSPPTPYAKWMIRIEVNYDKIVFEYLAAICIKIST